MPPPLYSKMKQETKAKLLLIALIVIVIVSTFAVFFLTRSAKITGEVVLDNKTLEEEFLDLEEGECMPLENGKTLCMVKKEFVVESGIVREDDVNITRIIEES